MQIEYVPYAEIDRQKYNSCIHYAPNGRAWGYKWYLDATAREFDVLIEGNYESVMPLVHDKTWTGRKRLFLPPFTQSLGVFSVHVLSQKRLGYFLREAEARFDVLDTAFTGATSRNQDAVDWNWTDKRNNVLDISGRAYEQIAAEYGSELLRSLQLSADSDLLVHGNQKPEKIAAFLVEHHPAGEKLQHPFLRIMYNALHRGWGWTSSVTDRAGNILAANAFVFTHGRVVSLAPLENPAGAKVGALNLLFDYAIRQAAGQMVLLDFMNTDKSRYAQFGAIEERFWNVQKSSKLLGVFPV